MTSTTPPPESHVATLKCLPAALGLPSVDLNAIAVECLLRFQHVNYDRAVSKSVVELSLRSSIANEVVTTTARSFQKIHAVLVEQKCDLDASLLSEARSAVCLVEMLCETVFQAHAFVVFADAGLCRGPLAQKVVAKTDSLWSIVTGRNSVIRFMRDVAGARFVHGSIESALETVRKCFVALEAFYSQQRTARSVKAASSFCYLLGSSPSTADCYAFAAVSGFLHADVSAAANPEIKKIQTTLRQACPNLVLYAEGVRALLFEDYAGTFMLRAVPNLLDDEEANNAKVQAVFAQGRTRALLSTAIFAIFYFAVVNADVIIALLGVVEGEEAEVSDEGTANHPPQQSSHTEQPPQQQKHHTT